jgi:AcrR family transcriptional regulator
VTIALVAARTDISEATILYHFPSRDHLLVAALERSDAEEAAAGHVDDDDAELSLEDFRASIAADPRVDRRARLLLVLKGQTATPDHPAVEYFAARNRRQLEIFTRLIARRQRLGFAHAALDPRQVALQLIATWDGLTALRLTDPTFDLADVLLDAYRRLAGENVVEALDTITRPGFGL